MGSVDSVKNRLRNNYQQVVQAYSSVAYLNTVSSRAGTAEPISNRLSKPRKSAQGGISLSPFKKLTKQIKNVPPQSADLKEQITHLLESKTNAEIFRAKLRLSQSHENEEIA